MRSEVKLNNLIKINLPHLEIVEGDLKNETNIIDACQGDIEYIIFVAGLPGFKWNNQEKLVMTNAMKAVTRGMIENNIKRILFLAGTPNKAPF